MTAAHDLLAALGPAPDFADAPCVGRWSWFDPPNDHEPAVRSTPATRPLCTCAAPARCRPSPAALPLPAVCPRRTAAVCGRGSATTYRPRKASDDNGPSAAQHYRAAHQASTRHTCPRSTVHASADTVRHAGLRTPDPRYLLPHPRATSHRLE